MKKEFLKKVIEITLITELMNPAFLLLEEDAYSFKQEEKTEAIKIESLEVSDGEEEARYIYEVRDKRNRLVEKELDPNLVKVTAGFKESRLNVIEQIVTIKYPDGNEKIMTEDRFEFKINEKLIAEEQAGSSSEE